MARIVPELNLNKVPQSAKSNSLILAKNIKTTEDAVLERDTPIEYIFSMYKNIVPTDEFERETIYNDELLGHIVGINHKIYFFIKRDITGKEIINDGVTPDTNQINKSDYVEAISEVKLKDSSYDSYTVSVDHCDDQVCRMEPIPESKRINMEDVAESRVGASYEYIITEYNEETKEFKNLETAWTWSGGAIDGCVINNNTTDEILVIAEYNDDIDINIPIKFINLTEGKHSKTDDESIYTQTPKIPITNLQYLGKFNCNIPAGVYQFFIRYKINEYLYTNWFSCSGELFTGDKKKESTVQGSCIHLLSKDVSSRSFKFAVNHLIEANKLLYKSFQLGFIISNKDVVNAREWKTFDIDTNSILFDYKEEDIKEANIDDFLNPQFNIFNPKNIIYFKNRLYCSNYKTFDYDNFEDTNNYEPNEDIESYFYHIETDESSNHLYLGGTEVEIYNSIYLKPKRETSTAIIKQFVKNNVNLLYTEKNTVSHSITYNRKDEYNLYNGTWQAPIVSMKYENGNLYVADTAEDTPGSQNLNTNIILGKYNPIISLKAYYENDEYDLNSNYNNANYYEEDDLITHCILNNDSKKYIDIAKDYITHLDKDLNFYITVNNNPQQISYIECKYISDFNISFDEVDNYIDGIKEPWLSILRGVLGALTIGGITAVPIAGTAIAGVAQWILDKCSATQYVKHKATITYKVNTIRLYPKSKYNIVNNYNPSELDYTTLNPFCKYEYYVHYISDKGFVTNGKKIGTNSFLPRSLFSNASQMITLYNKVAIYPNLNPTKYSIPTGFVGLFFSIYKQPLDACQLVNIVQNDTKYRGECYELDALIVKGLTNIIIKDSKGVVVSNSANYYGSNTTTPLNHFGCYGYIEWDETEYRSSDNYNAADEDNFRFAIFNDSDETNIENRDDIKELIRITPYIIPNNENNAFSYNDYSLPGYLCEVKKLDEIAKLSNCENVIRLNNVHIYNDGDSIESLTLGDYYIRTDTQAITGVHYIWKVVELTIQGITVKALQHTNITLNRGTYLIYDNTNYYVYYFINKFKEKENVDKIHVNEIHDISTISGEDVDEITKTNSYYVYDSHTINTILLNLDTTIYTDGNTIGILEKTYNESGYSNVTFDTSAFDVTGANIISAGTPYLLKSSFNLNYLSTIADSEVLIKFFTTEGIVPNNNEINENEENRNRYLLPLVPSLEVSNLLELTKTFREYIRKTYSVVRKENLTEFNNTVIASNTNIDEVQQYIFTFSPVDYYNIPTNRGEIVKLISLANTLYAHCSQGMFKFSGNNQLSTTDEEVNLKENDIFISGCLSVYDSIYGYGGLYKKSHSIVTFDFYIFYDKLINTIYSFDGNSIKPISINIKKLLENYTPDDILFSYDYINKRIFINLIKTVNGTRTNICVSYSFLANAIISIHDMDYMNTFSSRIACYFIDYNTEKLNCYKTKEIHKDSDSYNSIKVDTLPVSPSDNDSIIWIGTNQTINNVKFIYNHVYTYSSSAWHHEGYIYDIEKDSGIPNFSNLYGNLSKQSYIVHSPYKNFNKSNPSIIDIIVNDNYEQIKALNSVNWISSKILDYFNANLLNGQNVNELFPCNELFIYTDQTNTPYYEITFDDIEAMGQRKLSPYGESKPTYNCGIWTINDFRNEPNDNHKHTFDDKSLLYGKYFVIRFVIYEDNFRLENLSINTQNYEKV